MKHYNEGGDGIVISIHAPAKGATVLSSVML